MSAKPPGGVSHSPLVYDVIDSAEHLKLDDYCRESYPRES